jgi:small subunit ribosomal protein S20
MANTRSAAKQARASERRRTHNRTIKSKLHTLERKFLNLAEAKKANEAAETLKVLFSALDKAAKVQVVTKNLANRKKSRLTARLKAVTTA